MRDALSSVLLFAAGLVVGIRLLAALYGPIDLWYTIRTAWPVVLRRIVLWAGVTVAALLLLGSGRRGAFLLGMAAHLLIHVGIWAALLLAYPRKMRPTPTVE